MVLFTEISVFRSSTPRLDRNRFAEISSLIMNLLGKRSNGLNLVPEGLSGFRSCRALKSYLFGWNCVSNCMRVYYLIEKVRRRKIIIHLFVSLASRNNTRYSPLYIAITNGRHETKYFVRFCSFVSFLSFFFLLLKLKMCSVFCKSGENS